MDSEVGSFIVCRRRILEREKVFEADNKGRRIRDAGHFLLSAENLS